MTNTRKSKPERWGGVPGYLGYYVSTTGRVIGKRKKILKPMPDKDGYLRVLLYGKGKTKLLRIHHLVAITFIGPYPEGHEVCHLNGNNQDNRIENLKYVTPKENHSHKILHGTTNRGERNGKSKLTEKEARYILKHYKFRDKKFNSVQLGKKFGVKPRTIRRIIRGVNWKYLKRGKSCSQCAK